jgi:nitroreductase
VDLTAVDLKAADELLTTTRSVRKRLDLERPVPLDLVRDCLRIAQQAPTASNIQGWHFVLVSDPDTRATLAGIYRGAMADHLSEMPAFAPPSDPQTARTYASAAHLSDVLHRVPMLVVACVEGRPEGLPHVYAAALYGSIHPAVWSFMLALRARGIGSSWTSVHLRREAEAAELLGIPDDVTQVALLPIGYFTGDTFRPATRPPVETITHVDSW